MQPDSTNDGKRRLALTCDALRLMIEFSLSPGEFARIGSSPAVEITLPMVGIGEEELRLFVDDAGLLWMSPAEAGDPVSIEPPASFQAGPYHFAITEQVAEPAPAPRAVTAPTPPAYARPTTAPISLTPLSSPRPRWKVAASAAVAAALATGGVLWWVFRSPDASATKPETVANTPASPATAATPTASTQPAPAPAKPEPTPPPPASESLDLERLAQRVRPCVFLLQVRDEQDAIVSKGTGFAISAEGMVATNQHVIKNGGRLEALTEQGAKFTVARVIIEAPDDDLAILQLEATNLSFLPLGETAGIAVGKRVAVYGSPVGLAGTLSEGIISAIRKEPGEGLPHKGELLQTTAPVSPGSSGSPLLDAEGNVIGVMTLASGGRIQNLNFAVPVEAVRKLKATAEIVASIPDTETTDQNSQTKIEKDGPNAAFFADTLYSQLRANMDAKDWIPSLKLARQLMQKHAESAAAHFHYAYCAAELRLDDQAETSYKQSLSLEPDKSVTWSNLGSLLLRRNDRRQALAAFDKAASCDPDDPIPWHNIVHCSLLLKDWKRAASALQTLANINGESAWELAGKLSKLRIPDATFQRAVNDVLAHKEDNTLYAESSASKGAPSYFVFGVPAGDTLTVRSGAGTNFAPVGALANGVKEVIVTGKPRMNGSTEWVPIEANGVVGWVRSKYLRLMPPK